VLAVLWLLLISGAALKWAGLPASSSRIFGFAQIVLSSGVVVFGVVAVLVNSAWAIAACRVRCRHVGSSRTCGDGWQHLSTINGTMRGSMLGPDGDLPPVSAEGAQSLRQAEAGGR